MSPRLAISAAISVMVMAGFAVFSTPPAESLGADSAHSVLAAEADVKGPSAVLDALIAAFRR